MTDSSSKMHGRISTWAWTGLLATLCLSIPLKAAVVESWDFRSGPDGSNSWKSMWTLETDAAKADRALRIEAPPGQTEQALILDDVFNSRSLGGDDVAGTPIISHTLPPLSCGSLKLRAGTGGSQNQQATITLLSRGRPLLLLKLINNTTGKVVAMSGETDFSDVSWFNKARDFEIRWEPQKDGALTATVVFYPRDKQPVVFGPLRFLAPGKPDQIRLQVGYGSATGKSLRLEKLSLSSCN